MLVVSGNTALFAIPEGGGPARLLGDTSHVAGEQYRDGPLVVDDAHSVIYASWPGSSPGSARIAIAPLGPGKTTVLDIKGVTPLGVVDGTLVYVTAAGVMMGVPIDVAKRRLLGPPVQLIDNVSINFGTGLARASLSPTGTLFYQSGTQFSRVVVAGAPARPGSCSMTAATIPFPDSPRTAGGSPSPSARPTIGTSGWTSSPPVPDPADHRGPEQRAPEWSPDGRRVLFRSDRDRQTAIWWRPADLSAEASSLLSGNRLDVFEAVISPDARSLVFQLDTAGADLYYRALSGDTSPQPIANSQSAIETMPRLSPTAAGSPSAPTNRDGTRWWSSPSRGRAGGSRSLPAAAPSRSGRVTAADCSIAASGR